MGFEGSSEFRMASRQQSGVIVQPVSVQNVKTTNTSFSNVKENEVE